MGADEKAHVADIEITADMLAAVREAAMMCPCQAISLGEDDRGQEESGAMTSDGPGGDPTAAADYKFVTLRDARRRARSPASC